MNNYEYEIRYREMLLQKVRNNSKITSDERIWLVTHPVYNQPLGFPFFNVAIENLEPNKWYLVRVKLESTVRGNVSLGKPVKMLGFELEQHQMSEVKYLSVLGLLSVEYECDYFDEKQNLYKRQASSTGDPSFAMKKEIINNHLVKYRCKSPIGNSFDAMVFTIEWTEADRVYNMEKE